MRKTHDENYTARFSIGQDFKRGRLFGEYLQKRVDFNSFKDTVNRIGVLANKIFSLLMGFEIQHEQAARFICKWTGEYDAPLLIQAIEGC